jgi:predicted RNA binding protein YcfA (HicA-like mRNA interferase family)
MVRPVRYRALTRALRAEGCRLVRQGRGDHEVWECPCGRHRAVVVRDAEISAGVVRSIIRQLECLPEGWLR